MADDGQTEVALGEAWFVAFPASRAAAERWVTEMVRRYGEDLAHFPDEALPEIAARQWIPHLLAEIATAGSKERVREVLVWVEEAAAEYGENAWWLTSVAAEAVLRSENLEQVYPMTGPNIRERLPECVGWEQEIVAILESEGEQLEEPLANHLVWARDQLARYRAIVSHGGKE